MASICRSAAVAAARSPAFRFKPSFLPKSLPSRSITTPVSFSRSMSAAVGMTESLMPFHSATASARLRSFIAVDSCHWNWLSQGRALPL